MDYSIETFDGAMITGIKQRMDNSRAMEMIPGLWAAFFNDNIQGRIDHQVSQPCLYGVYTAYESDMNGAYDFVIGVQTTQEASNPGLFSIFLHKGSYAVFKAPGKDQVAAAWQAIWQTDLNRTYLSDFECYDQATGEVKIYIGVENG